MSIKTLAPSVTVRDPKGLKFMSIVEARYNKAQLSEDEAQRVNDTPGLSDLIGSWIEEHRRPNQFANEEVRTVYGYPREYKGSKPIEEQIEALVEICDGKVDPSCALAFARNLPDMKQFVPADALRYTGWFATLWDEALVALFPKETDRAQRYCNGVSLMLEKIAASRSFTNWRKGQIDTAHLRIHARTMQAMDQIALTQKGGILIIAGQLGIRHGGRSVRRAREVFVANEYGTGSLTGTSVVYTHPERLVRWEELDMDLPGDEFSDGGGGQFGHAPYLSFYDGTRFDAVVVSVAGGFCGSSSFFAPQ
ncbi:MAG: hypothetical protein NTY04_02690 [Candidatus Staskawiczbacteria bacterium]|nr:hypothetical protein [Candidatus Staskawiczbacteria bacterium]